LYKKNGADIILSDTPREVRDKLSASDDRAEMMRQIIERVKFMAETPSDEEKDRFLREICLEVRNYF